MEAIRLDVDAFLYSEIEMEDAMESTPDIEGASHAGGFLRAVAHYRHEREQTIAGYDAVIAEYTAARDGKAEKIDRRLAWLEGALQAHYVHSGQFKLDYPDGTMSVRKGRERVEVANPADFCSVHADTVYVRETISHAPDKGTILAAIKAGGEIPEGADIVRGDDTFTITTK